MENTTEPVEPLTAEVARWLGKSGFVRSWDRCVSEAEGLFAYLREQGLALDAARAGDGLDVEAVVTAAREFVRSHDDQATDDPTWCSGWCEEMAPLRAALHATEG